MNPIIRQILSGSCMQASDLLSATNYRGVNYKEALDAYNDRLPPANRYASLYDAAADEVAYCIANDI